MNPLKSEGPMNPLRSQDEGPATNPSCNQSGHETSANCGDSVKQVGRRRWLRGWDQQPSAKDLRKACGERALSICLIAHECCCVLCQLKGNRNAVTVVPIPEKRTFSFLSWRGAPLRNYCCCFNGETTVYQDDRFRFYVGSTHCIANKNTFHRPGPDKMQGLKSNCTNTRLTAVSICHVTNLFPSSSIERVNLLCSWHNLEAQSHGSRAIDACGDQHELECIGLE